MSCDWTPAAILPNLEGEKAIEGDVIAIVPCDDARVECFGAAHPKFKDFVSRFTDAFGVELRPLVLIVHNDVIPKVADVQALSSFRDLAAMCTVPYGRAMASIYPNGGHRLSYANSFLLYPWMLGRDNEFLVANTPALNGGHVVDEFRGQSSPEIPEKDLKDIDRPLFKALYRCWKRHYLGKRKTWSDRALFRSLNMATNAAQLPGGIDTTLYDLGRITGLWVSAFEILAHPRTAKSGLQTVYPLLESVKHLNPRLSRKLYVAHVGGKKPWPRRPLTCWLYGELYKARNEFLHGNPVSPKTLSPRALQQSLFWFAPGLYRLALTGFLDLPVPKISMSFIDDRQYQSAIERAILKARK